jgi:predicted ArsR family transcriptional regulator
VPVPADPPVTDPKVVRALAHPIRLALIDALSIRGPLTATEAAGVVGQSQASCSFHLRQLAKYGFVEEAGGRGGRERPWRLATTKVRFQSSPDADLSLAVDALDAAIQERTARRVREWRAVKADYPKKWQQASGSTCAVAWLTVDELSELDGELEQLISRYVGRTQYPEKRPAGARPVQVISHMFPVGTYEE